MGRVDPALLSVRRVRSFERSMVLVRLLVGRGRNAQRTIVVRGAVFCFLAIVAKRMASHAACARGLCGDDSVHSFTVASAHSRGLGGVGCFCCYHSFVRRALQIDKSGRVGSRNYWVRRIRDWCVHRRQLRLVASRFYLRHRTLSVPFYQLMLQPSITALAGWLVIEGSIFVGSFWITAFAYHAAMDLAPALPCRIGAVRARIGATSPRSRSARADCNRSAVAADVRTSGSDA